MKRDLTSGQAVVLVDRQAIVRNLIRTTDASLAEIEGFAKLVFFEPGWRWTVVEVVNGKPEFYVTSYDPEHP